MPRHSTRFFIRLRRPAVGIAVFAWVMLAAAAWAQPLTIDDPDAVESLKIFVERQIQAYRDDPEPEPELQTAVTEVLAAASSELQSAQNTLAQAQEYRNKATSAPDTIAQIEDASMAAPVEADTVATVDTPLVDLEQRLAEAKQALAGAQARLGELQTQQEQRGSRRKELPALLSQAHQKLEQARTAVNAQPASDTHPALADAQRQLARAAVMARESDVRSLRTELETFDILDQLAQEQLGQAQTEMQRREAEVDTLQDAVDARRLLEAENAAEQARAAVLEAAEAGPQVREAVRQLTEQNRALVNARLGPEGLLRKRDRAEESVQEVSALRKRVEEDYKSVTNKEARGAGSGFGALLHRYRSSLPGVGLHLQRTRELQQTIAQTEAAQRQYEVQRRAVGNPDEAARELLAQAAPTLEDTQRRRLTALVRDLLDTKRTNLLALQNEYGSYVATLVELETQERELVGQLQAFHEYIEQHVLWVRNSDVLSPSDFALAWRAMLALTDAEGWRAVVRALRADMRGSPVSYGAVMAFALAALGFRRRLRRRLREAGELASKPTCTTFWPTVRALADTFLLALPLPLLLAFVGWRFEQLVVTGGAGRATGYVVESLITLSDLVRAFGNGLQAAALVWAVLLTVRRAAWTGGLADAHLGWPRPQLKVLRWHVLWFMPIVTVLAGAVFTLQGEGTEAYESSLGRIFFLAMMSAVLAFNHITLRAKGAVTRLLQFRLFQRESRWHMLWYAVAVAVPVTLIALALLGYYYTALQLSKRLFASFALGLTALLISGLVLRWLLVMRRHVAIEQARKRRAAAADSSDGTVAEAEQEWLDVSRLGLQTQRLVRGFAVTAFLLALWFVWAPELPAMAVVMQQPLYGDKPVITIGSFLIGLLVGVLTVVACRNVPALLEISVLQRAGLGAGERYAIRSLVTYALGAIGIIVALQMIGVTWSKLQWLVAAMGVGLGFGLQEIFANLISGVIILFERPVRVGDVVTVGDISGTVTRIRIRATSIMSFDRKELIVPNKEFVTSKVVNWTLSDTMQRVLIPVTVPQDTDVVKVLDTLQRLVNEHPLVVRDPAPAVSFAGFGEGTLKLELVAFTANLEHSGKAKHELHMSIVQAFRVEGIEFAFPQRDVHIRTVDGVAPAPVAAEDPKESAVE